MRILIAEDDVVSRRILEATLSKWGYDVVVASDGTEAWHVLQGPDTPKLAILDWMMPGMDGIEICRQIRKRTEGPYIYVLLHTAKDQRENVIEGLDAGADDYIAKPFDSRELKARLRAGRRVLDLQAELLSTREALRYQATHDYLTRLWNRAAILDILRRELAKANREETSVGVIMADLDHFKEINDTYGHAAGDAVLFQAARRMHSSVRTYDAIGRYGGEEFLIILPGCEAASAMNQAVRLRACVGSDPVQVSEKRFAITLSLGVVAKDRAKAADVDSLILAADAALYQAKTDGRNRVVLGNTPEPPPGFLPADEGRLHLLRR